MGLIGWALAIIVVAWGVDRLVRGSAATPLRERQDAKAVGNVGRGVSEALPFLGQQNLNLPEPPPPIDYEPEPGANTIVLPDERAEREPADG